MNTVALIIGSTGTLGKQLIPLMSQDYKNIILSGRNNHLLEEQKIHCSKYNPNIQFYIFPGDINEKYFITTLQYFLVTHNFRLESIINTSYYSQNGKFIDIEFSEHLRTIQTNIISFMHLVYWFIQYSQSNNSQANILSISSMCSLHGIPNTSIYSGTKSFLVSFFQALSIEYPHISITVSCPGPFSEQEKAENIGKKILNKILSSPESVAKKSYKAFKKGKLIVYPDIGSKLYRYKIIQFIFLGLLKKFYKYD